jgi:hypothetical protein
MNYYGNSGDIYDMHGRPIEPDDAPDQWCMTCRGKGGSIERQDPVGDGVGFETFFNPCPDCLGAGRCPWCGGAVDEEYYCLSEHCSFEPGDIDAPGSCDDDDDDYGYPAQDEWEPPY